MLAQAGRPELFHTIVLRTSLRSWTALKKIHDHEILSRLVRTFVLDVTLWRIGTAVRDWHEWTRYCESRANHYSLGNNDPAQAALFKELAQSRRLWEAYLTRLEEEKAVIGEYPDSVIQLPNLQKVHVVRGNVQVENGHVRRLPHDSKLRITAPLRAWRGDTFSSMNDINKLTPQGFQPSVATKITKWRLDGLTQQNLQFHHIANTTENPSLISLKIRDLPISPLWSGIRLSKAFRLYLSLWHNLESLEIHTQTPAADERERLRPDILRYFGPSLPHQGFTILSTPLLLQRLRKLSLAHFRSTPEALISLLNRHSSTLKDLRLNDIRLRDEERPGFSTQWNWQMIFRRIGESTNLEKLKFSGLFLHKRYQDGGWDFDDGDLGVRVAAWIMKGCDKSQWEEILLIRRSFERRQDQASGVSQALGQNGTVNADLD